VLDKEDGYIPYCDKCNARVTDRRGQGWDLDDDAEVAWEEEMERRYLEDQEDKKKNKE
jgi:hypothetical protein